MASFDAFRGVACRRRVYSCRENIKKRDVPFFLSDTVAKLAKLRKWCFVFIAKSEWRGGEQKKMEFCKVDMPRDTSLFTPMWQNTGRSTHHRRVERSKREETCVQDIQSRKLYPRWDTVTLLIRMEESIRK